MDLWLTSNENILHLFVLAYKKGETRAHALQKLMHGTGKLSFLLS